MKKYAGWTVRRWRNHIEWVLTTNHYNFASKCGECYRKRNILVHNGSWENFPADIKHSIGFYAFLYEKEMFPNKRENDIKRLRETIEWLETVKLEKGPVCRARDKQTDNLQREFDFMGEDIPDYVDMKKAVQSVIKDNYMDRLFPFCGDCKHISGGGDLLHCGKYTGKDFDSDLWEGPGQEIYRCDACLKAGHEGAELCQWK